MRRGHGFNCATSPRAGHHTTATLPRCYTTQLLHESCNHGAPTMQKPSSEDFTCIQRAHNDADNLTSPTAVPCPPCPLPAPASAKPSNCVAIANRPRPASLDKALRCVCHSSVYTAPHRDRMVNATPLTPLTHIRIRDDTRNFQTSIGPQIKLFGHVRNSNGVNTPPFKKRGNGDT